MIRSVLLPVERVTTSAALFVAGVCLAVAASAGFWQVISRFVLSDPAIWSEALVRLALIWMAMLGFASAVRRGALVSIDITATLVKAKARRALDTLIALSTLALCGILGWFGLSMALRVAGQEMAGLGISIAWGYAAIPLGCAFATIAALAVWIDPPTQSEHVTAETEAAT